MTDPQKDEHIEELLSKLQGIFGKLSRSDEEEAKQKIEAPAPKETPDQTPQESSPAAKPQVSPEPLNFYTDPPPVSAPPVDASPSPPPPAPVTAPAPTLEVPIHSSGYATTVPTEDPERLIVPTAVFFPPGRETEAKSLAQKLE